MMLLAILDAAIGLLEFRSNLQVWACHLPFQVAVFAMLMTLLFARPCLPETCLYEGAFTFRHVVLPLGVPSFAPISVVCTAGQDSHGALLQAAPSSDKAQIHLNFSIFGWVLIPCRLSRA